MPGREAGVLAFGDGRVATKRAFLSARRGRVGRDGGVTNLFTCIHHFTWMEETSNDDDALVQLFCSVGGFTKHVWRWGCLFIIFSFSLNGHGVSGFGVFVGWAPAGLKQYRPA